MNILVISCHPLPESFCWHVRSVALDELGKRHQVEHIDLYQPIPQRTPPEQVDALVFVYPTWWAGLPAALGKWLEEFCASVGYQNLKKVVAITTHGSPRWVNWLIGRAGQKVLMKGIPRRVGRRCRSRWIAFYNIDRSTPEERQKFSQRVREKLAKL